MLFLWYFLGPFWSLKAPGHYLLLFNGNKNSMNIIHNILNDKFSFRFYVVSLYVFSLSRFLTV